MINIEDLIKDIRTDETENLTSDFGMDEKKMEKNLQMRIEQQVLQAVIPGGRRKKSGKRKWMFLLLAATLMIGSALTATAAVKNDWDVALVNFMGLSDADTVQLPDGKVELKASSKAFVSDHKKKAAQRNVTMRAVTSIGDKNSAYIRIDTDYQVPDDYNEKTDYILPEDMEIDIRQKRSKVNGDHASTWTGAVENGKLYLLLAISDCEKLNKSRIHINIKNLILYHDGDGMEHQKEERICDGVWDLEWKYAYCSNVRSLHPMKYLILDGENSCLTKLEVSPISIRASGIRIRKIKDDYNMDRMMEDLKINEIRFTDGSSMKNISVSSAGCKNGITWNAYWGLDALKGTSVDVRTIQSIKIANQWIQF